MNCSCSSHVLISSVSPGTCADEAPVLEAARERLTLGRDLDRQPGDADRARGPRAGHVVGHVADLDRHVGLGDARVELVLALVEEERAVALQGLELVGVEGGDHRLEVEAGDGVDDVVHRRLRGLATDGGDALLRHVEVGLRPRLLGGRVEEAQVPATVLLDGRDRERDLLRLGLLLELVELGEVVLGDLLAHEVAERQVGAVDARRQRCRDGEVDDVVDVRRVDLDGPVADREVDAADAREAVVGDDVPVDQPRHEALHRLAERLALTGQQDVDGAEGVLVVERVEEQVGGRLGRVGAAGRRTVAADAGDGEDAGSEDGHSTDRGGDDLARRPAAAARRGLDRRHGSGRVERRRWRRRADRRRLEPACRGRRRRRRAACLGGLPVAATVGHGNVSSRELSAAANLLRRHRGSP